MWPLNLAVNISSAALNAGGGYHWLWMRRFVMPFVIGIGASFASGIWWVGLLCLPAMGTLCLGYFSGHNWGRGLWLFTQALGISMGCLLTGHLEVWFFVAYVVGAGVLGGLYKNWQQILGDAITGVYLSSFVWGVHG